MINQIDPKPIISVIVPFYNVKPWLKRCLDSLANQTMKEIEIVCIDDGSTDGSSEIAEAFISDSRFRVIHHEKNRGISAARNTGINVSQGSWIMFVDSDDWVEPDFCELPYKAALGVGGVEMVIFQYSVARNGNEAINKREKPVGIADTESALRYGENALWNKLFDKKLFRDIHYPEGKVYEDVCTTYKVVLAANKILIIDDVLYHYNYRKGSVSHRDSAVSKKEGLEAAIQKANDLKSLGFDKKLYEPTVWFYAMRLLMCSYPNNDPMYRKAEEVVDSIPGIPKWMNSQVKAALAIWKINKRLFHFICRISGRKDETTRP